MAASSKSQDGDDYQTIVHINIKLSPPFLSLYYTIEKKEEFLSCVAIPLGQPNRSPCRDSHVLLAAKRLATVCPSHVDDHQVDGGVGASDFVI